MCQSPESRRSRQVWPRRRDRAIGSNRASSCSAGRSVRSPATSRTVREIWLLRSGALQEVVLHTEADGACAARSDPLTEQVAHAITDAEQWRQERSSHAGVRLLRRTAILTPSQEDPEFTALEGLLRELRGRMER